MQTSGKYITAMVNDKRSSLSLNKGLFCFVTFYSKTRMKEVEVHIEIE